MAWKPPINDLCRVMLSRRQVCCLDKPFLQVHRRAFATESPPAFPVPPTLPSKRYLAPTHTPPPTLPEAVKKVLSLAAVYLLPVYVRPPIVLSHGKGSYVWDTAGRVYLDFAAGIAVNALGHGDEEFVKALANQASKVVHTSNVYHNEWAGRLAELIVTLTQKAGGLGWATASNETTPPTGGAKVFFTSSGTEANEGALKIARSVGKARWASARSGQEGEMERCTKTRIACFENSFHGRSMGALSVTTNPKYQKPFEPLIPGIDVGKLNDVEGLQTLVGENTCAVIVEPVQGEGGVHVANPGWLQALRKRCDEVGAVLIFDEIQCGLYRTGTLWAHSPLPTDCHPDVVTMAKPLANGYPIGAVLMKDSVAETMTAGTHGTTFGGSPLACAMGFHVLSRLSRQINAGHVAAYLKERLELLPKWFPGIVKPEIRGRGLILGIGFLNEQDPGRVVSMARERGLLVLTAGKDAVRLVPSLTIGLEEVDLAMDILEGCLGALGGK